MPSEPTFPITASPAWLLGILVGALAVFHVILLRVWRLGKLGWKRVDYVWLGIAALGLVSAAADVRRLAAIGVVEAERARLVSTYSGVIARANFMTGIAVCRKFVRSEFSPPDLDKIQQEYDQACEFGRQLRRSLPTEPPTVLDRAQLPPRPRVTDRLLLDIFAELDQELAHYERARKIFDQIQAAQELTQGEKAFATVWPLLLTAALALRITKVSGEIRLEA